jgi:aminoglycoside phosphotransferase (APT) family kinase protein
MIDRLNRAMLRITGAPNDLSNLTRLSGGAVMESWSFDWGGTGLILRRAPSSEMMADRPFGHDVEAALVQWVFAKGVRAPEVIGELADEDGLGTGYIMRRVEAVVDPAMIVNNPPSQLIEDITGQLAKIHALLPDEGIGIPVLDIAQAVEELDTRFQTYGGDRPIIALAIKWCRDNKPEPVKPCLVHGDFRMGNLMVSADGLAAVLDWELAHWGDPHEDLAYGCMTVWRFGQINKPAFGLSDLDHYFAAYRHAGGRAIDPARFRFWLIYRTLWWALGCLQMAQMWRSGIDATLERAVIGRRTSEQELDLLLLLEEDYLPQAGAGLSDQRLRADTPNGEPAAHELIAAVRTWIASEVKPAFEGRARFMAAVAANALGMLEREASHPISAASRVLAEQIAKGTVTLASPGVLQQLRHAAFMKLMNDNPKYAALAFAREKWSK